MPTTPNTTLAPNIYSGSLNLLKKMKNSYANDYYEEDIKLINRDNPGGTATKMPSFNRKLSEPFSTHNNIDIDKKNEDILKLRAELDQKLQELYYTNNSLSSEHKVSYDTTMYTGILWTILATSVLYYVFVKL